METVYSAYYNEHDQPIERSPRTHPYSYEGYVTYRVGKNEEVNQTLYSDRLLQEDYNKTRTLMMKHFDETGDYYSNRPPDKIQAFLREWLDKPNLKIIFIMEYCNQSSGYPYWRFDVNTGK